GNIRIRRKGSAGGHNGIKDIIAKTGSDGFSRIKVGVGQKPQDWDLADYVLSRFSEGEREKVEEAFSGAVEAVTLMVQERTDEAMNRFNRKKPTESSEQGV
ncbi:MAG: aminoacyl-tRNA hydrolase, partial [Eubacterium sp.]